MTAEPDFPPIDSPRTEATSELGRFVIAEVGMIEPHIDETDSWATLPMRVSHNDAAGVVLELGPYDLGHRDIERLREAIRDYDVTVHGNLGLRRVK